MSDLDEMLACGEPARLIPIVSDSSKENRAASILLATVSTVKPFAKVLLDSIGQRLGARAVISCYTEVVFNKCPDDIKIRPDGLLVVTVGKRSWSALIEAKIGRASLDEEQIAKYCQLAKLNGIDAIITLSNQFAALPTHHPVKLKKSCARGISLYHWSWMNILTQATLLLHDHEFDSDDQRYLLNEMARYFRHDSVGVSTFDRMNPDWKELVLKVQSGARLAKGASEVENSVAAWHQEQRDLCLLVSRKLRSHVTLKLSRAHTSDPVRRLKDDCEELVGTHVLQCVLDVPDAAAPITTCADIGRRTIACSMLLAAPKDRKRADSRINWLLRQLSHSEPEGIYIKALWPGRAQDTQAALGDVRDDPFVLVPENGSLIPQAFEVIMLRDLAGKFSGSKTFIEHLESFVPHYYEQVGQRLRAWVPPPPKLEDVKKEPDQQKPPQENSIEHSTKGYAKTVI